MITAQASGVRVRSSLRAGAQETCSLESYKCVRGGESVFVRVTLAVDLQALGTLALGKRGTRRPQRQSKT